MSPQQKQQAPVGRTHMASQSVPTSTGEMEEDRFQALMQAISGCQTTLTGKIDTLQMDFGLLQRESDKIRERLGKVERRVGKSEDSIWDHCASLHTLKVRVKALKSRAEDSGNRSRRNNLRVVGLPEGAERKDPTAFTETLPSTLLPQAQFFVERAHRMPPGRNQPGATHAHFYF